MKRGIAGAAVAAALSLLGACGGGSEGGTTTTAGSAGADSSAPAPSGTRVMPGIVASDTPGSSEYLLRADAAETKRKEVEDQVVDGPCESDDQCGLLGFKNYVFSCDPVRNVAYRLDSPTAAAVVRGTQEFNELSDLAAAVRPLDGNGVICAMYVRTWVPRCEADTKKCVAVENSSVSIDLSGPPPIDTPGEPGVFGTTLTGSTLRVQ